MAIGAIGNNLNFPGFEKPEAMPRAKASSNGASSFGDELSAVQSRTNSPSDGRTEGNVESRPDSRFENRSDANEPRSTQELKSSREVVVERAEEEDGEQEVTAPSQAVPTILTPDQFFAKSKVASDQTGVAGMVQETNSIPQLTSEQRAMAKFFKSMEIEMGVKPQQIVKALGELDQKSLLKTPEETMEQVVANLEVHPLQKDRAMELYQVMLSETAEARVSPTGFETTDMSVEVLSPEQRRQEQLLNSIERLNKNFFSRDVMPPLKGQTSEEKRPEGLVPFPVTKERIVPVDEQLAAPEFRKLGAPDQERNSADVMALATAASANTVEFDDAMLENEVLDQEDFDAVTADSQGTGFQLPSETPTVLKAPTGQSFSNDSGRGSEHKDNKRESQVLGKGEGLTQTLLERRGEVAPDKFMPAAVPIKVTSEQRTNNVQDLVTNARLLVQKGGGEMKVSMTPEGMGKIDMKVAVNDGKVDIQMVAESREAKRILEGSLDDLRNSLSQHKLNLDTVKVDVGNRTGNEQMDMGQFNQGRETARDFLGQFHQFNQGRREAFMDAMGTASGGVRMPAKKLPKEVIQEQQRTRGSARRLNLVA